MAIRIFRYENKEDREYLSLKVSWKNEIMLYCEDSFYEKTIVTIQKEEALKMANAIVSHYENSVLK